MELLIAFLLAFGAVSADEATKLSENDANEIIAKSGLEDDYIIWEVEMDDF